MSLTKNSLPAGHEANFEMYLLLSSNDKTLLRFKESVGPTLDIIIVGITSQN